MRCIKIVFALDRCHRGDRVHRSCREPALYYFARCRAAGPVTHASGIRSIARARKPIPLGSRAVPARLAARSAADRERG